MLALIALAAFVLALASLFHFTRISKIYWVKGQWTGFRRWKNEGREAFLNVLQLTFPDGHKAQATVPFLHRVECGPDGAVASFPVTGHGVTPLSDPRLYAGFAVYLFLGADTLIAGAVNFNMPSTLLCGEALPFLAAVALRGMRPVAPDWNAVREKLAKRERQLTKFGAAEHIPFAERNAERKKKKPLRKSKVAAVLFVVLLTIFICGSDWQDTQVVFHSHLSATGKVTALDYGRRGACYPTITYRDQNGREQTARSATDTTYPACKMGAAVDIIMTLTRNIQPPSTNMAGISWDLC